MSGFTFRLPIATSDFLTDIPKSAKTFLREGFNVLAGIQPPQLVTGIVLESAESGSEPKAADLASKFGLSKADSQSLVGVISFLGLLLSKPGEPEAVPTIVNALLSSEILDKSAQATITVVLNELDSDRSSVTSALRRTSLASRLLPSLTDLGCVVDVRIGFDNDQVALAVPVVLVHIDTDSSRQEIWFQMSKGQLQTAIEDLTKTLLRVEAAEKWSRGQSS
jgi:hypothetical protein